MGKYSTLRGGGFFSISTKGLGHINLQMVFCDVAGGP